MLRRVPQSMMADDVRADFYASVDIIEQMSNRSGLARRALPMLSRLRHRIRQSTAATTENTTPVNSTPGSGGDHALLDMLFGP